MWCIVGCDPDVRGALAVITGHDVGCVDTVRIFDCPTQTVMVNRRPRKRVCVHGMVALVRELDLPAGTVAHLEVGGGWSAYNAQTCFVQGAASGTWHGVLVSHDFDVRLVAASTWKWALKLARRGAPRDKNESRDLAKSFISERYTPVRLSRRVRSRALARSIARTVANAATMSAGEGGRRGRRRTGIDGWRSAEKVQPHARCNNRSHQRNTEAAEQVHVYQYVPHKNSAFWLFSPAAWPTSREESP